jgi:hypothetical protein
VPEREPDSARTRVEPFFDALLARDNGGGSWLGPLLAASAHGHEQLGELVEQPGWLEVIISVPTADGRRGAFTYPALPDRGLLGWMIDHPEALARPTATGAPAVTRETEILRRALLDDDPPGTRARAQDRAHDLLGAANSAASAWWRFEEAATFDCALITDRLVLTVLGSAGEEPLGLGTATPWLPARTALVRDLEAAQRLAAGKAWGTLLVSDVPLPAGTDAAVAAAIEAGAPHLDPAGREALRAGYLGNLTWAQAAAVTGLELAELPHFSLG